MLDLELDNIADYLDMEDEDVAVNHLIEKYNLSQATGSFLYGAKDEYYTLIDFIISLYLEKEEIPADIIETIKNNLDFKTFLLQEVKQKMNRIMYDNSTILFKEIVSIINLLSFGKDYNIFTTYNFYDVENISQLFRYYEDYLSTLESTESENFELTFTMYVTLIETFNELCVLNQTDVQRKKTIGAIIAVLTETINMIKYKITLDDEKINILNNILGKLLFYYSHVPFVNTDNKDLKYIIDEYHFLFERQTDGYQLSKNTNFGNTNINRDDYYLTYLGSATTLLLTLIYKIELKFTLNDDFYDLQKFSQIIESYQDQCKHVPMEEFNQVSDFKKHLLNNYTYIYNKNNINHTVINFHHILDELILEKEMSSESMNMIRDIILYSNDIQKNKLEEILSILIDMPKIRNDYFEFFKLSIIDIIIIKFTNKQDNGLKVQYLDSIYNYIEKNRVASHLMGMYSKINLSLALYHSYYLNIEAQELSKDFYFGYVHINGNEPLENEYKLINEKILNNYGKMSIANLDIEELNLEKKKYIEIGKKVAANYFKYKEITLKYEINQNLSDIITHIFNQDGLDNDTLNNEIESFISQKIFYGLVFSSVDGLCERNCRLDDIGYEKVFIDLIDGYKLKFAYSTVYKHTFEQIYSNNKEYIQQNIKNLIISYIKSIPLYIDPITNLDNLNKLEKVLLQKEDKELVFIEIYIDSLVQLNKTESFNKSNTYFKTVANEINKLATTYRTHGPRLGIILKDDSNYKDLIERIRDLKVTHNGVQSRVMSTIAVSWGNPSNIIEKSHHALLLATNNLDKYHEFK